MYSMYECISVCLNPLCINIIFVCMCVCWFLVYGMSTPLGILDCSKQFVLNLAKGLFDLKLGESFNTKKWKYK